MPSTKAWARWPPPIKVRRSGATVGDSPVAERGGDDGGESIAILVVRTYSCEDYPVQSSANRDSLKMAFCYKSTDQVRPWRPSRSIPCRYK